MADHLEAIEREVAESRARLADTLDRLTSPETSSAAKRDLMDTVHKAKDELLNRARDSGRQTAQGFADSLKQRAIDNPFAVALIGAGSHGASDKKPPVTTLLVGAGLASLMMSGGSRRGANRDPYRDPRRQGYVPGGVAGYGYPVEEDAPEPSLTERAGAAASSVAERARAIGERARDAASTAAAQVSNLASGAAAQVSETVSDAAAHIAGTVAQAEERARMTLSDAIERTSSGASEAGLSVAHRARDTTQSAIDLLDRAQRNPVVLGAVGFAAGLAISRSVRATDTGERVLDDTADAIGEGARRAVSGVTHVASRAAETAGGVAASTRAMAAGLGAAARQSLDTAGAAASAASEAASSTYRGVRDRAAHAAADAYESVREAASRSAPETASAAYERAAERASFGSWRAADRRPRARRQAPGLSWQVRDEVYELGRRYPLLLGAIGLAVGAAVGGALDPTETENRMLGEASDRLKQRAREMAGEQYEQVADSVRQIAERVLHRSDAAGPDAPGASSGDRNRPEG